MGAWSRASPRPATKTPLTLVVQLTDVANPAQGVDAPKFRDLNFAPRRRDHLGADAGVAKLVVNFGAAVPRPTLPRHSTPELLRRRRRHLANSTDTAPAPGALASSAGAGVHTTASGPQITPAPECLAHLATQGCSGAGAHLELGAGKVVSQPIGAFCPTWVRDAAAPAPLEGTSTPDVRCGAPAPRMVAHQGGCSGAAAPPCQTRVRHDPAPAPPQTIHNLVDAGVDAGLHSGAGAAREA